MRIERIVEKSSDTVGERGNGSNCWFYNFEDVLSTCRLTDSVVLIT